MDTDLNNFKQTDQHKTDSNCSDSHAKKKKNVSVHFLADFPIAQI